MAWWIFQNVVTTTALVAVVAMIGRSGRVAVMAVAAFGVQTARVGQRFFETARRTVEIGRNGVGHADRDSYQLNGRLALAFGFN